MTEKSKKYLSDILMAIDLIEKFTVDITSFNIYQNDLKQLYEPKACSKS